MSELKKERIGQMLECVRRIRHFAREEFLDVHEYRDIDCVSGELDRLLLNVQSRIEFEGRQRLREESQNE